LTVGKCKQRECAQCIRKPAERNRAGMSSPGGNLARAILTDDLACCSTAIHCWRAMMIWDSGRFQTRKSFCPNEGPQTPVFGVVDVPLSLSVWVPLSPRCIQRQLVTGQSDQVTGPALAAPVSSRVGTAFLFPIPLVRVGSLRDVRPQLDIASRPFPVR
jgi:hypothetical protein